jgi:hypothetical protein
LFVSLIPLPSLFDIFGDVLLLQFPHSLNLVQIDDEACVVTVMQADALAAEYSEVVAAVEVLHSLRVLLAELLLERVLVLVGTRPPGLLEVEVGLREDRIFFHHLVQNVDVQGESLGRLQLLNQLPADRAPHSVVVVKVLDAGGAQGMAAVDQDTGDTLTHVVLATTELADVEGTRTVVEIQNTSWDCC